jgi:hypothetical protein
MNSSIITIALVIALGLILGSELGDAIRAPRKQLIFGILACFSASALAASVFIH